jgi:hypothetical protein
MNDSETAGPGAATIWHLTLGAVLLAGLAGAVVFEFIALVVAPVMLGNPLLPARLVVNLGTTVTGTEWPMLAGWIGHLFAGIVVFPLGYAAFLRLTGLGSWFVAGAIWGVVLWFLAQGVFAPVAGGPFMGNFTPFTFISLAVHLVYALAVALALHLIVTRSRRG